MSNNEISTTGQDTNVPAWRTDRSVPVPTPDRATRVASWIGWHLPELAGVTVPAAVAVAVSPWAWLVSGVVGAGWTVHTVRFTRAQAALKAAHDQPADTSTDTSTEAGTAVEEIPDGPAADPVDDETDKPGGNAERDARGLA